MNAQDKAEALRLMQIFEPSASELDAFAKLRALIERQPDDTDGEMWRFCVGHGFPSLTLPSNTSDREAFGVWVNGELHYADTPAEAVQAAMAAMKEKA